MATFNIPYGKNWRFGFVFKAEDGTPLPTPPDTMVNLSPGGGAGPLATGTIEGDTCLIASNDDPANLGHWMVGTTAGQVFSPTTLGPDGVTPIAFDFTIECLAEQAPAATSVEGDAGAEEAKVAAQSAGAQHGKRRH